MVHLNGNRSKRALGADRLGTGINGSELRGANKFENARRRDRDHMRRLCASAAASARR